jgi:hypothetical protein
LLKEEDGAARAAGLREHPWPRRAGLVEAVAAVVDSLDRYADRLEYPE